MCIWTPRVEGHSYRQQWIPNSWGVVLPVQRITHCTNTIHPPHYTPTSLYTHLTVHPLHYTPTSLYTHLTVHPPHYTPTLLYTHLTVHPPHYTPTLLYTHLTVHHPVSSVCGEYQRRNILESRRQHCSELPFHTRVCSVSVAVGVSSGYTSQTAIHWLVQSKEAELEVYSVLHNNTEYIVRSIQCITW